MAGTHERLVYCCKIVAIRIKTGANAIDVAKRGKEPERLGKKDSAAEEVAQSLCAGSDEAIAYRRRDDCPCSDHALGTRRPREDLPLGRGDAGAVGLGRPPHQRGACSR